MPNRKALCVGINTFKNFPTATLQGCVNDANDMTSLLKDLLGFSDTNITRLTDQQATKANIMGELKKLVDEARNGKLNYIVFSMSSHGTQVPDRNNDETDRADEAFCPHDLAQKGNQWDPNHIIVDDELHDLFVQIPSNVLLEVYLDTCHSGTGLKAIDLLMDRRPRYLPPPSLDAFREMEHRQTRNMHTKLLEKGITHHILWAACRPNQTAADAHIANAWHGAFTYYFCKEMRTSNNKLSRAKLLAKIRTDLATAHYTQTPQLECEATVRAGMPREGILVAH